MSYQHAVVWLDHLRAVVIDFAIDQQHVHVIASETEHRQVHRKSGPMPGSGFKSAEDRAFFDGIVAAIGDAREILVVGPGQAKTAFLHDLEHRHAPIAKLVVGVEAVDHPSNDELLKFARQYFKRVDNLRGV
jgi:stalled ribosome rescue protein Dom34